MEPGSGCTITAAVETLGDQWSFIILRDVIFCDRRYFRELLASSFGGMPLTFLPTG